MSERPLVSVVTGTWQRHDLLLETIENVQAQTYRSLEHVIVSDGPDAKLYDLILESAWQGRFDQSAPGCQLRYFDLGRNTSTLLPNSYAAAPFLVGMLLARGKYITWCADDERMEPDHIATLVDALEAEGADMAYSQTRMWWVDGRAPAWIIGSDPPQHGQITNVLFRADLMRQGTYPLEAGMSSDWVLYERWLQAGALWAYVPRVTLSHRVDH